MTEKPSILVCHTKTCRQRSADTFSGERRAFCAWLQWRLAR
jgi:hypothetical protein